MSDIQAFADQYGPLAVQIGNKIGVAPDVILGQLGLETGWGKSVIPGTNNLGNIKDFSGGGTAATDNQTGSTDNYRTYETPDAFGTDYVSLLTRKYPAALNTGSDATAFATALKNGGYAEDPKYASKVSSAVEMLKKLGEGLANAISGTAQASELPASLQNDTGWNILNGVDPKSAGSASSNTPASLANDPGWKILNGAQPQTKQPDGQDVTYQMPNGGDSVTLHYDTPQPTQNNPSTSGVVSQVGRQLGLTARAIGHGVGDVLSFANNPFDNLLNQYLGTHLEDPGAAFNKLVDSVTPTPVGSLENGVQAVGSAMANPINYLGGEYLAAARGLPQMMRRGAEIGGLSGIMQPPASGQVTVPQMVGQGLMGAAGGAVMGPALGGLGTLLHGAGNKLVQAVMPEAAALSQADSMIAGLRSRGIDVSQVPPDILGAIRGQVSAALKQGKILDPAALLRQKDFQGLGIQPTLGQVTRDPMQYARERDLRGIDMGGGQNPLAKLFNNQQNQLLAHIGGLGANEAGEAVPAGNALMGALRASDAPEKAAVDAAYAGARDMSGRAAQLDVAAFSKSANDALDSKMLGHYLPPNVRGMLSDVSSGKTPFNVNTAVQMDQVLSAAQRNPHASDAEKLAIGQVRDALNSAPIDSSAGKETKAAFDRARAMAKQRFEKLEKTPALKAALDGVDPDNFVNKYVIHGTAGDVTAMAQALDKDPAAKTIVRSQIAEFLRSKAFGANTAGDKTFAQESYNKALNQIGTDKLAAFFTPQEIDQFRAVGRVGAYIGSQPAGSAVNNSNMAAAALNLFNKALEGIGKWPGLNILRNSVRTFNDERAINNALQAKVVPQPATKAANQLIKFSAPVSAAFGKKAAQ